MKDINARIDWKNGMELSAQTFVEMDNCTAGNMMLARRIAYGTQFGILPGTTFCQSGVFVKKTLEISPLTVTALMPSGALLHVDESVAVDIPMLYGSEYYLGCMPTEQMQSYTKERVPMLRPEVQFGIFTLEEVERDGHMPLMKFQVEEGRFSIDHDYIPPFLILESEERYATILQNLADKVEVLSLHAHLQSGEAKRSLMRYAFVLRNFSMKNRVQQLLDTLQELAQTVDYYIMVPNKEEKPEHMACSLCDVAAWLKWLTEYLHGAATLLDTVEPEEEKIDLEELKAQIKEELYQKLYPELKDKLYTEVHDALKREIYDSLMDSLSEYINGNFKRELYHWLEEDMAKQLHGELYQGLYDALYSALFVPQKEEEEEEYMPLI
jgi:hypothetical protein